MIEILASLKIEPVERSATNALFRIPSWRIDLEIEADLIEEVARIHGLNAIPDRMPDATAISMLDDTPFYARAKLRQLLLGMGFSEAMHYSFLAARELDAFDKRHADKRVLLPNPVSADYGVLRGSLLPQLASSLGRNAARQVESAALFELGRVFNQEPSGTPREEERLALGLLGPFWRTAIDRRRPIGKEEAMLTLKGAVERIISEMYAGTVSFTAAEHPAMERGWAIEIALNNVNIGCMGLLSSNLRHQWRMTNPMPLAEMLLAPLLAGKSNGGAIKPVPQYPAVRRDLAFVADASITHQSVVATARKAATTELTGIELFDIFTSKEIGKGRRSLAYSFEFRSPERTLTDLEVNENFAKIIQALKSTLNVEVREG